MQCVVKDSLSQISPWHRLAMLIPSFLDCWTKQDEEPCTPRDADAGADIGLHPVAYFILSLNSTFREEEGRRLRSHFPLILRLYRKVLLMVDPGFSCLLASFST